MKNTQPPEPTLSELASEGVPAEPAAPAAPPAVVAVVVTKDPGPWFEATLAGLRDQDYPNLAVLVLDAGSAEDPTARIAAVHPRAFVRRLDGDPGFAAAANEALTAVEGAAFLLLCHDDVVPDPSCIRLLVEEAYRSNAAVVGPKLVAYDDPEVLLEVGLTIDRFGIPYSDIEPGELDQEQHDAVRDVFHVSSAVMLVRADLFRALDGFDPVTFPGGEDLDLCWRARLLGGRVMVVPDARARHLEAADEREHAGHAALGVRNRLRVVLKAYSAPTLTWVAPVAFLLGLLEAAVFAVTRRGRRARAVLAAWAWNLGHLPDLRRSRRAVQAGRTVHDRDLSFLQVRGSARIRAFVTRRLHADDRLQTITTAGRDVVEAATTRLRRPLVLGGAAFLALVLVGSRTLVSGHVPWIGSLIPWPGVRDLASAYGSGWRFSGLGSTAAAPPALLLAALSGSALLGFVGLAQTVVVVGAIPFGAYGAYRIARPITISPLPAFAAGLAYGASPVARNAIGTGRLGPLVFFALAPLLLGLALRGARPAGTSPTDGESRPWLRSVLALGGLLAVAAAFFPPALVLVPLGVGSLLLASPLAGGARWAVRALGVAAAAVPVALLLLVPWPWSLVGSGTRGPLGVVFRPDLDVSEVLRFETGPAGAGWTGWGLLAAAALPLAVASGPRLAWATRAWSLALVGFAAVWVPSRFFPDELVPAPEGALSLAALGLALAVGLGVGAVVEDLRRAHFGWRQLASVAAVAALAAPALGFLADAGDGRWHAPGRDWVEELSWMDTEVAGAGAFRVLWLGDPSVLPLDPAVRPDGLGYGLTRDGPGDLRDLWPAPVRGTDRLLAETVDLAAQGRTSRLGHALAPMSVRYVAVVERPGPEAGARVAAPPLLLGSLQEQLDLARLESEAGLVLYENTAWAPTRAVVTGDDETVPLDTDDPKAAAMRTELDGAVPVHGPLRGSRPVPSGMLLWSEAYDTRWRAGLEGDALEHVRTFGWANGYEVPAGGSVSLRFDGQWARYGLLTLQVALWVGWAVLLSLAGGRDPSSGAVAGPAGPATPHERGDG